MRIGNVYRPYSPEEVQKIVSLWDSGKTAKEIAKVVGRTPAAIHQFIHAKRKSGNAIADQQQPAGDAPTPAKEKPAEKPRGGGKSKSPRND